MPVSHTHVNSSTIQTIGYNPDSKTMRVRFHSGKEYTYHDVPPETHEAFIQSGSKGQFLHQNIKGVHKFTA